MVSYLRAEAIISFLGTLLPSVLSSLVCSCYTPGQSMPRQTKKRPKGDLNFMTPHIPIKFKEHNYSQQGKPPQFSFSEAIRITLVARRVINWIWKYPQNGTGIFGQEIIPGIPFIFPDLLLVPDTKWPSEAETVTGWRGWAGGLYQRFVITTLSPQWKESRKWRPLPEYLNSQNQFCFTQISWEKVFS